MENCFPAQRALFRFVDMFLQPRKTVLDSSERKSFFPQGRMYFYKMLVLVRPSRLLAAIMLFSFCHLQNLLFCGVLTTKNNGISRMEKRI